jgi:hypothetical protein
MLAVMPLIDEQRSFKKGKRLVYILSGIGAAVTLFIFGFYLSVYSITETHTAFKYPMRGSETYTYTEQVFPYQQIGLALLAIGWLILAVVIGVTAVVSAIEKSYSAQKPPQEPKNAASIN